MTLGHACHSEAIFEKEELFSVPRWVDSLQAKLKAARAKKLHLE